MEYKYVAWKDGEYMGGYKLFPRDLAASIIQDKLKASIPVFASVQTFDKDGKPLWCPLYADFDGYLFKDAHRDAVAFYHALGFYNIKPIMYYSGSKGFHVIAPIKLEGQDCHLLAGAIAKKLGDFPTLDKTVYTIKRLLRVVGSIHEGTHLHKVEVTPYMSPNDIVAEAYKPRFAHKLEFVQCKELTDAVYGTISKSSCKSSCETTGAPSGAAIPECVNRLMDSVAISGERNHSLTCIGVALYHTGISLEDAIEKAVTSTYGAGLKREINSVFRCIYKSGARRHISCNGVYKEILHRHCIGVLCERNPDDITLGGKNGSGNLFHK